jgi:hypothetical protein
MLFMLLHSNKTKLIASRLLHKIPILATYETVREYRREVLPEELGDCSGYQILDPNSIRRKIYWKAKLRSHGVMGWSHLIKIFRPQRC